MGNLKELTTEERRENLERSLKARRERAEFKAAMKRGEISVADALDDPRAQRLRVSAFLGSIPGVGKTTAEAAMQALSIPEQRRVRGLGKRQREALERYVANASRLLK